MKPLALFSMSVLALSFYSAESSAFSLKCRTPDWLGEPNGVHFLVAGVNTMECETNKGKEVTVDFTGFGPGLRYDKTSDVNFVSLVCPTISHRKLVSRLDADWEGIRLFGVELEAGVYGGAKVGVLGNHRGGVCTLAGVGLSFGGSASIAMMEIRNP